MNTITSYKRNDGESELELIYRITSEKDKIGSWQNVADILNELLGTEYTESKFRKQKQAFDKMLAANQSKFTDNSSQLTEIEAAKLELQKERKKISDARVDYNRLIRQEARKESYADMVKRIICENVEPIQLKAKTLDIHSDNDLLIHVTDVHTGIEIHNWRNDFDQNILKERMEKYISEILKIQKRHNSENAYIVIGEVISGIIHNNLRLQNNMDMMEQFKFVSEIISSMLSVLSANFHQIYVYVTPGNHSRISPKKEDSLDGENIDLLLPFYLKARMQNFSNIHICENTIEPEIAMFNIRGSKVFAAHGHKDSPTNVVQNFTLLFGMRPDIVLLGHRHTNGMTTVSDVKIVESGCCSGADQYAVSIRKANRPEQTVSVIDNSGLVCLYDIQLDN